MVKEKKRVLIGGCIDPDAKMVIDQALNMRMADLDPTGNKTKFLLKIKEALDEMNACDLEITDEEPEEPVDE